LYAETAAEWVVAGLRRRASDTTRATAAALDAVATTFTHRAQQLGTGPASASRSSTGSAGGGAATLVIRGQLVDLVQVCIEERWPDAQAGDLGAMAERAGRSAAGLLGELERKLRHLDLGEPAADHQSQHPDWLDNGQRGTAIATDQPLQLLCGDDQVHLLSRDLHRAVTIRFAPRRAMQMLTETAGPGAREAGRVVWTRRGAAAGVLHLVPLKAGVRQIQIETMPADEPPSPEPGW
jgi:hypothetical protein